MKYQIESTLKDFQAWAGGKDTLAVLIARGMCEQVEELIEEVMEASNHIVPTATDINDFLWFDRDYIAIHLGYEDWEDFDNAGEEELDDEIHKDINGVRIDISDEVHWHDEAGYDEHGDMIDFTVVDEDGTGYYNLAYEGEENPERWAYYTEIEII